ncbi:MAG: KpsF/GutQ family sugar-phosphate isomerase [Thermodesulfobacteriota bacterium]|nr:KpsF/GutQ family sugar-phosphate isomerase [Thermodesulfobacteriota bacterium]
MTLRQAKEVLQIEAEGILKLIDKLDNGFIRAVELIYETKGRVIVTGIGKSGIVGRKISATLSSTGTAALFLHPVEAMHGDLGMVGKHDIVIAISNSGETKELTALIPQIKHLGARIVALTGNLKSTLAAQSDVAIDVGVEREACPLGLAPTASTTAVLAMGDALAVTLLHKRNFNERDFYRYHPSGSLGDRLKVLVGEVMLKGKEIPVVPIGAHLSEAIKELNKKNIGAVLITREKQKLAGIITDGDIRRAILRYDRLDSIKVEEIMTTGPKAISADMLAADALSIMQKHEITVLPIVDTKKNIKGILHLHDLLGKGEFKFLV